MRTNLRRGWTTGACATAAASAAMIGYYTGHVPAKVRIKLPGGQMPTFQIAKSRIALPLSQASVIKDAGDDPDVTHGCEVEVTLSKLEDGAGLHFRAGAGVGIVTRKGLPLCVGEAAINPGPRAQIQHNLQALAERYGSAADFTVTISIPDGAILAQKTWNRRLGIVGGLSILGTTGIVIPYSCAAWIHSIYRGIDVARANQIDHLGAATGSTSQSWLQRELDMSEDRILDVGDFVGAMAKYLTRNPVQKLSLAGGMAKISKLAQGAGNLHSSQCQLDFTRIQEWADHVFPEHPTMRQRLAKAETAFECYQLAGQPLGDYVATLARNQLQERIKACISVDIYMIGRTGELVGKSGESKPGTAA
ncbi:MAG: cobalt-precorrin-5B (C(1))-methyltransferase [Pseudomonadota bacterium]